MVTPKRVQKVMILTPSALVARELRRKMNGVGIFQAHGDVNAIDVYDNNGPFDLVVVNCRLTSTHCDPARFVRYIRDQGDDVNILVISDSYELGERLREAGANDFIESKKELEHAVRVALELPL